MTTLLDYLDCYFIGKLTHQILCSCLIHPILLAAIKYTYLKLRLFVEYVFDRKLREHSRLKIVKKHPITSVPQLNHPNQQISHQNLLLNTKSTIFHCISQHSMLKTRTNTSKWRLISNLKPPRYLIPHHMQTVRKTIHLRLVILLFWCYSCRG